MLQSTARYKYIPFAQIRISHNTSIACQELLSIWRQLLGVSWAGLVVNADKLHGF